MIFKIKKYFRTKKKNYFQDELINKLNEEHQKLFSLVGKMEEALQKNDLKKLKKFVGIFKKELELHVLYEDTNLYEHLYLRYYYYEEIKEAIKQKHNEMKGIVEAVENFIAKYANLTEEEIELFIKDFELVKQVLVKRVGFEEDVLYDIYSINHNTSKILEKLNKDIKRRKD